ncbi:SDR family oxidoreductase [Kistimonas asteriae]|uniref:SDR family oxidoreductase n=1 Tax=Kistimonas asteriae TaxID=517724 RepID=UPI001BABF750|nr:SDR family oxidoreductase [Kistimonas asteriae]
MKTVLITGCSTGIGRALSISLCRHGFNVWATARNPESIADLKQSGIKTAVLDVTDSQQVDALVDNILATDGRIDMLINNAGYGAMGAIAETPIAEIERQFTTNTFAPVYLIQRVIPSMRKQGSGTLINIGSVSGILTSPFSGIYCASKAALHTLSEALRIELAPFGIDVITVQPGAIQSSFGKTATRELENILPENSLYQSIEETLRRRAGASQERPTTAEAFSEKLVSILLRKKKPAIIRIGRGSFVMPFIRQWLPQPLLQRLLSRLFNLNKVS